MSQPRDDRYERGDLIFREFGHKTYRGPEGGAAVFSCSALHEVTPVTRGERHAFVAFLYGEEDAKRRVAKNSGLHVGLSNRQGRRAPCSPRPTAPRE